MAFGKYIGWKGLAYRGGLPMLSFLLHRITAVGIILFVCLHILASFAMQEVWGNWGTTLNVFYESWIFQIFVYFCVIFHTLNGLRIVLTDFLPRLLKYQREILILQWLIFVPIYALALYIMFTTNLASG
jgi:succinate dehydrogenase / fumarate reductase cytochrome b subunit